MMTTPTIHVFERAGLGKAPYTFRGVEVQSTGCQYCGTAILFKFWLESVDGKRFFVGSDCIFKSGDAGLRRVIEPIVKQHMKDVQDARFKALIAKFDAYLVANPTYWQDANPGPHPYPWYARQGKTMGDYKRFCYEHSGLASKSKIARQCLIGLGLELPARKAASKVKR